MKHSQEPIISVCPLYVCSVCHTKAGHPHQQWCTLPEDGRAECEDCIYGGKNAKCSHPYKRKGGSTE